MNTLWRIQRREKMHAHKSCVLIIRSFPRPIFTAWHTFTTTSSPKLRATLTKQEKWEEQMWIFMWWNSPCYFPTEMIELPLTREYFEAAPTIIVSNVVQRFVITGKKIFQWVAWRIKTTNFSICSLHFWTSLFILSFVTFLWFTSARTHYLTKSLQLHTRVLTHTHHRMKAHVALEQIYCYSDMHVSCTHASHIFGLPLRVLTEAAPRWRENSAGFSRE